MTRDPIWNKDDLPVRSPCSEDWDAMDGDERRRFCGKCERHVFDLSAMTRAQARALVDGAGPGGLCVRYAHDEGGGIMFRPEPILPAFMILPARRLALGLGLGVGAAALGAGLSRTQGSVAPPRQLQGEVAAVSTAGRGPRPPAPASTPETPAPPPTAPPPAVETPASTPRPHRTPKADAPPAVRLPPRLMGKIISPRHLPAEKDRIE